MHSAGPLGGVLVINILLGLEVYTLLDRGEVYSSDQSIEVIEERVLICSYFFGVFILQHSGSDDMLNTYISKHIYFFLFVS